MKVSVITINYNNQSGLSRTIESVINQDCNDFEYLIIDGGSQDGSKELIENAKVHLSFWCAEKDNGIYNAMNKGIAQAKGDYLLFMNSGDTFYNSHTLTSAIAHLSGEDLIYGDVNYVFKDKTELFSYPDKLDISFLINNSLSHQATFIKRELLIHTPYNESNRIVSDWEFCLQAIVFQNCSYKHINQIVAIYDTTGISSIQRELSLQEKEQVLHQYFPKMVLKDLKNHADDKASPLYTTFKDYKKTRRFQRRVRPLFKALLKVNNLISKHHTER